MFRGIVLISEGINEKERKTHNYSYDLIRILAMLMVLYNHRPAYRSISTIDLLSVKFLILAGMSVICKCGPPLFFMVSGALLLCKKESFGYILRHRISRILIVMLLCSVLVKWPQISINGIIDAFLGGLNWYLYAYLGYLVMLPLMRIIALHITEKEVKTFWILSIIMYTASGLVIVFEKNAAILNGAPFYNANWASNCWQLLFPFMGFFLSRKKTMLNEKWIHIGALLSIITSVLLIACDIRYHDGKNLEMLRQHFILIPSCSVFLSLKMLDNMLNKYNFWRLKKMIVLGSGATFGMFLIETHTHCSEYIYERLCSLLQLGIFKMSLIAVICEFVLYAVFILILKCIPGLKKVL